MKVLLVVDVQPEFNNDDEKYSKIVDYIKQAKQSGGYEAVYATVCGNKPDGSYVRYANWNDLIDGVKQLDFEADRVYYKTVYGLKEAEYREMGEENEYTVIGYNTGACVLKVCLDLFDLEYDFRVLKDYCYSSDGPTAHYRGLSVMYNLFENAVV